MTVLDEPAAGRQRQLQQDADRAARGDGAGFGPGDQPRRGGRAKVAIVAVMLASIAVAGVARQWSINQTVQVARGSASGARGSGVAGMNSFALALLLGGLRGPLVMLLWTSSESQKAEKNLEDFDTKVEWIRMLQPEFDTVHIFQVWNKAYNVSVQMASLANKYATILDALDYAQSVNAERPNNVNIVYTIAQTYFDKLGNSSEKNYYKARVRRESLPHEVRGRKGTPGWRRTQIDQMLDADGRILPAFRGPLKELVPYEPYRYGLSPIPLSYAYYAQARDLQANAGQRHAQISQQVVDSRPALTLKVWAEDEQERGRRAELAAFGKVPADAERTSLEEPTAAVSPTAAPGERAKLDEALDAYDVSARVARDAVATYETHLRAFADNLNTYQSHLDLVLALDPMSTADAAYLRARTAPESERQALLDRAAAGYADARERYARVVLKYYTSDELAAATFPPGFTRERVTEMTPDQVREAFGRMTALLRGVAAQGGYDAYAEDRREYEMYISRATARLAQLGKQ